MAFYFDASPRLTPASNPHLVAFDDDGCGPFGQSRIAATGLLPGVVHIAVTTFGETFAMPQPYVLKLASDTSCP